MNLRKGLIVGLVAILLTVGLFVLTGCQNEKNNNASISSSTTSNSTKVKNNVVVDGDKVNIDGALVKKVEVKLGTVANLSLVFENNTDNEVIFDLSQVSILFGNEKMSLYTKGTSTISANQSYTQWGFPFVNSANIKAGDVVEVYYNNIKIADANVIEN